MRGKILYSGNPIDVGLKCPKCLTGDLWWFEKGTSPDGDHHMDAYRCDNAECQWSALYSREMYGEAIRRSVLMSQPGAGRL